MPPNLETKYWLYKPKIFGKAKRLTLQLFHKLIHEKWKTLLIYKFLVSIKTLKKAFWRPVSTFVKDNTIKIKPNKKAEVILPHWNKFWLFHGGFSQLEFQGWLEFYSAATLLAKPPICNPLKLYVTNKLQALHEWDTQRWG